MPAATRPDPGVPHAPSGPSSVPATVPKDAVGVQVQMLMGPGDPGRVGRVPSLPAAAAFQANWEAGSSARRAIWGQVHPCARCSFCSERWYSPDGGSERPRGTSFPPGAQQCSLRLGSGRGSSVLGTCGQEVGTSWGSEAGCAGGAADQNPPTATRRDPPSVLRLGVLRV